MTSSTKNKAKWNALRMTSFYSFEPLDEIKDKTIEFEQSLSPDFDKIEQHAFSYLDEFFLKRLTKEENNLFKVVRDIEITNGLISMDILAKQNNTTRRQLHLYIFLMKQKHSDNFDLLRYLTSQKNDGRMAPYYLASKACLEDLKITHPFKNYFYTIGLYYGEGTRIRIGTTDYNLTRGSLLTIGPGMTCQWLNTSFPSNDTLFFYDDIFVNNFSRSFFYSLEFFCPDEKSVIQLSDRQFEEMQQLFSTLRAIADKPEAVSGILYSILIIAQKYFWKLHRGNKKELNGKEHTVVKFRELVSKNFSAYKEVAFYAEQLHISPKYLSEILVEYTGLSAKKWIEFHIMQEAKYLLSFWNMSVKEVSFQLGYTDTSHFSRAFRSYDGQLPTEFKNTIENPT